MGVLAAMSINSVRLAVHGGLRVIKWRVARSARIAYTGSIYGSAKAIVSHFLSEEEK